MADALVIDGAHGEGGGQILRTALTLVAVTGRPIRIEDIRAGRPRPGLAAQHVTAVRAAAALRRARLGGDAIGSRWLEFDPTAPVRAGAYAFDVAAREGGSAGAASLVLQTVLVPLALADGESRLSIRGGTHPPWSPPFDYLRDVWLPALRRIGLGAEVELAAWGWYPVGRGEIRAAMTGLGARGRDRLRPLDVIERGRLRAVGGRAVTANLPAHISQRMVDRAGALLERELAAETGVRVRIEPERVRAACPGAGIFLTAEYEHARCGFSALGERGKPAEQVAEEAVAAVLAQRASGGALDVHLADQILVPLAPAPDPSRFSAERPSRHLETNAWVIERFGLVRTAIAREPGGAALVTVSPEAARGSEARARRRRAEGRADRGAGTG